MKCEIYLCLKDIGQIDAAFDLPRSFYSDGSVRNALLEVLEQYVYISTTIKVFKIQSCNRQTDGQCIDINKGQVFIFLVWNPWVVPTNNNYI